ncbi:MAG: hypothetical protein WCL07_00830 [bacterium]
MTNIAAMLTAIIGVFSFYTIIPAMVLLGIGCLFIAPVNNFRLPSLSQIIPVAFIASFVIFLSLFNHETYFGGRDNGVYANSALSIVKTKTYKIDSQLIGSYPGYEVNNGSVYQPAFFLGYISWLSVFILIFGYQNIMFANSVLLFFGLINLYALLKKIVNTNPLAPLLVTITSFPFFWFTRSTYSENIAFMLFMFILNSVLSRELAYIIIASTLLICVRIESVLFIGMLLPLAIYSLLKKQLELKVSHMLLILLCIGIVAAYYTQVDRHYLSQLISMTDNIISNILNKGTISNSALSIKNAVALSKNALEYHIPEVTNFLLIKYNQIFYIFIVPALFVAISKLKQVKSQNLALIIFLSLPQLFYLFNPMITLDQPWFLRRFYPLIIPISVTAFYYLISIKFNEKIVLVITALLITINLLISSPIMLFSEYKGIYNQLEEFNKLPLDKSRDLIMVDYNNVGNYKLAEPLHFIYDYSTIAVTHQSLVDYSTNDGQVSQALYSSGSFSIPDDICKYKQIYLLTNPIAYYDDLFGEMEPTFNEVIKYDQLHKECEIFRLTPDFAFHEMAHLNTNEVLSYCDRLPHTIDQSVNYLVLYKLNKSITDSLFKCQ